MRSDADSALIKKIEEALSMLSALTHSLSHTLTALCSSRYVRTFKVGQVVREQGVVCLVHYHPEQGSDQLCMTELNGLQWGNDFTGDIEILADSLDEYYASRK